MKIYIDFSKQAITKIDSDVAYVGDVYSNVFEVLFFNYGDAVDWFPTMSQLAPNSREAGDFNSDALDADETYEHVENGITYMRYTFTIGEGWVRMKGRSNFFIWVNKLIENDTALQRKCYGKVSVVLNESTDNYFIQDIYFNPKVKEYIDNTIGDDLDSYKSTIDEEVESQNETIASLIQASPNVFDTASNIALLTENNGVAVATDTGYIYYWDSSLPTPAYVSSGVQYNSLANYVQKKDRNIDLFWAIGDFDSTTGKLSTNKYRITTAIDYSFDFDIQITCDWVTYKIYLYQYENGAWVGKGWKATNFVISANTIFRLVYSTQATLTQNLSYFQVLSMQNALGVYPTTMANFYNSPKTIKYNNYAMKTIAHRGLSMFAPENTASAFKQAKLYGFDIVECDIHYTSDDVPVIIHDYSVDRTSDGSGNVADLTLAQLKALDFGKWFNDNYEGEKILTLEEFITLIKGLGLKAYVELKNIGNWQVRARHAQEIVALIKSYNMLENIIFISASGTYLEEIKNVAPTARLGYVSSNLDLTNSDVIRFVGLQTPTNKLFFDLENNSNITQTVIDYAVANNIDVEIWLVNDAYYLTSIDKYISGITTNGLLSGDIIINKELL